MKAINNAKTTLSNEEARSYYVAALDREKIPDGLAAGGLVEQEVGGLEEADKVVNIQEVEEWRFSLA